MVLCQVLALFNGEKLVINIDEGSELNCVDANFMHKNNLQIVPTNTGAKIAGRFSMQIEGQTGNDVLLDVLTQEGTARINLGICLVVKNLGVEILSGQPAKFNHQIITIPHSNKVVLKDIDEKKTFLSYSG